MILFPPYIIVFKLIPDNFVFGFVSPWITIPLAGLQK